MVTYPQRIKQRYFLFRLGYVLAILGFASLIGDMVLVSIQASAEQVTIFVYGGMFAIYLGAVLITIFSRIGWSKSIFIDVVFNQFSLIVTIIGFVVQAIGAAKYGTGSGEKLVGLFLFFSGLFIEFLGIIMAVIGMYFDNSSPDKAV